VNAPSNAPFSQVGVEASGFRPFALVRQRHRGSIRLDDFDGFFEDGAEVCPFVAAEGSGDVFPDHESGSNMDACPSITNVTLSHLLYDSDLLHE
jgi:hypothetical protein